MTHPDNRDKFSMTTDQTKSPAAHDSGSTYSVLFRRVALAFLGVLCLAAAAYVIWGVPRNGLAVSRGEQQPTADDGKDPTAEIFRTWGKPEFVFVLSGSMHGYLQPCGCSVPQTGGMARRYNLIDQLKKKGWKVVPLDLGGLAQQEGGKDGKSAHIKGGKQALLKHTYAMKALKLMGYKAIGLGKNEFALEITKVLGEYTLQHPTPAVLAANLKGFGGMNVKNWEVVDNDLKIGVVGMIGVTTTEKIKKIDSSVNFEKKNGPLLMTALKSLQQQGAKINVLLYQGEEKEAKAAAKFCNDKGVPLNLIVCRCRFSLPPSVADRVGSTKIVPLGEKGQHIGVVGVFRMPDGKYDLKYKLVTISPDFETAKGQEANNPVMTLMEEYAKEVKRRDFLNQVSRSKHPVQVHYPKSRYLGSERCWDCHEHAYDVWSKSKHAHAHDALVYSVHPGLRQYDPECVHCHVVGYDKESGYLSPRNGDRMNKRLKNVGCESCHGPASVHVDNPLDKKIYPLINPFRSQDMESAAQRKRRMNQIDQFCQECHDQDNDVHWNFDKWKEIAHPTPKKGRPKND